MAILISKSDLTDKIKSIFFPAAVLSILLYGCTKLTLTKRMEKKFDGNYTRLLWAIKKQVLEGTLHKKQLCSHLPPMRKTNNIHHHHVVLLARISLTLSRHFSISFIASGRPSGLHPGSSHSCCMYVPAGRRAFVQPYVGSHRSTWLISASSAVSCMSGSSNLDSFRNGR